jgi:5-oxoprolinase (ATP-hydrolysing) subunit A
MKPVLTIDLNADLGEQTADCHDEQLMHYVTSANIACGGHAGNRDSMTRTLELALKYGVAAGAHPSYPDRQNFGRTTIAITPAELRASLAEQIQTLREIATHVGIRIGHVKPHGALYHSANSREEIAHLIADVAKEIDPSIALVAQAGSVAIRTYRDHGLTAMAEAFADRRYEPNGKLSDRSLPAALLDAHQAATQALEIALHQRVTTAAGILPIAVDTLCLHSDTPGAASIAQSIRTALEQNSVRVQRFTR